MRKRIKDLYVDIADNGESIIGQTCVMSEDQQVRITPEQVDILITWLKEVKENLANEPVAHRE